MDFDFVKERYDHELQRKEQLTSALALPVGVLSLVGGVIAAMARSFTYDSAILVWWFVVPLGLAVAALGGSLIAVSLAYYRQQYKVLPSLRSIDDWERLREAWNQQYGPELERRGQPVESVDAASSSYLREQLIIAADWNATTNNARGNSLYWSRMAILISVTLVGIAGPAYLVDQVRTHDAGRRTERPRAAPRPRPAGNTDDRGRAGPSDTSATSTAPVGDNSRR